MKTPNCVIISPEYPPITNWGGQATFNLNLSLLLKNICDQVHVITYDPNLKENRKVKKSGITIHYVGFKTNIKIINFIYYKFPLGIVRNYMKRYIPDLIFALEWNIFSFLYYKKLKKNVGSHIVHTPSYYFPALLIKLLIHNTYLIVHLQGHLSTINKYKVKSLENKIMETGEKIYINKMSDKVIACSNSIKNIYEKKNPRIKSKITHSPNFIINTSSKAQETFSKTNKKHIIYFGRVDHIKGVDILLRSFIQISKKHKSLKLFIIGNDQGKFIYKGRHLNIKDLVNKLKIPENTMKGIYFFPNIKEQASLHELLILLNGLVVVPSRYEPFGFVTIEAMRLGLPVLVSENGGGKEIITDGVDGYTFKPDAKTLSKLLVKMFDLSDDKLLSIKKAAQQKALNTYGLKPSLKFYKHIYSLIPQYPQQ